MKAIILDGFFAGLLFETELLPVLKLARPATQTWCDCNADQNPEPHNNQENSFIEYKRAAWSDDCALYSLKGDLFEPLTKSRDWVIDRERMPGHVRSPLYLDCRDDRAWKGITES